MAKYSPLNLHSNSLLSRGNRFTNALSSWGRASIPPPLVFLSHLGWGKKAMPQKKHLEGDSLETPAHLRIKI